MADTTHKRTAASLADVAEAAGVSKMTVSRVLRNTTGFSSETHTKVMEAVEKLGYVPNRLAAAFGTESATTLVGVCVPRLTNGLYGEVLESIDHTLSRFGYQTMIGANDKSPETEEQWLRTLLSWRPAGVILTGRDHTPATVDLIRGAGIPIIEIWDLNTTPLDVSVGFSHFDSGYEMGRHIAGKGRQRIGYVGTKSTSSSMNNARFAGFSKALGASGLEIVEAEHLEDRSCFYAGFYGTENLLNRGSAIDAIYFQDDTMAIGGLYFCRSKGLKVPTDIGIAGWGGMEAASVLPLRLTTTAVSTHAVGKAAAEALVARLRGEPVEDVNIIPTHLVPGATL
ncbi:MAG: LacI family DNA-binding transcriptional regulator [Pseudomonadota bacterium]